MVIDLGEADLMEPNSEHTVIEIDDLSGLHLHPKYNPLSTANDIGKYINDMKIGEYQVHIHIFFIADFQL